MSVCGLIQGLCFLFSKWMEATGKRENHVAGPQYINMFVMSKFTHSYMVLLISYAGSSPTRTLSKRPISATEQGVLSPMSESPPTKVSMSILSMSFMCDVWVHQCVWWYTYLCFVSKHVRIIRFYDVRYEYSLFFSCLYWRILFFNTFKEHIHVKGICG